MKKFMTAMLLVSSISSFAVDSVLYTTLLPLNLTASPFISSTYLGLISAGYNPELRESLKAVRDDAINYLGDSELTEKLEYVIDDLQEKFPSLKDASDEEMAGLIVVIGA